MHQAKEMYAKLLRSHFPPVKFAFAYGSAVFKQHGRDKGKMLDLIFAVDNPLEWHEENIKRNKDHYSFLQHLGSETVTRLQKLPAGVYYNPFVTVDSQLLKYGVISVDDLLDDLLNWRWLYISGRLHKPVLILSNVDGQIQSALEYNLRSAVLCALLCLRKPQFSALELFMAITSLSFKGDFRMIIGEDKHKVRNIVKPCMSHFLKLYKPYTNTLLQESTSGLLCMVTPVNTNDLPPPVRSGVQEGRPVETILADIVSKSSYKQSAKGILTAGYMKTIQYSIEKLLKMARSL